MPKQYEDIRDSYEARGKSKKVAEKLAAMTYNAHRPAGAAPVGPHSDEHKAKVKALAHSMAHKNMRR